MNENRQKNQAQEYLRKLREQYEYYKARYEKARAQNINEFSRFYPALQEIEHRYVILALGLEFFEIVGEYLHRENPKKMVEGFLNLIAKEMFFGTVIINENGKKEYIWQRVRIKKDDTEAKEALALAQEAMKRYREIDFECSDKEQLEIELQEIVYHTIIWNLISREIIMPVNRSRKKKKV